jgi:hypothetical protein
MGDQQDAHRPVQAGQHRGHPGGGRVVQVRGRLVEQQQPRAAADPHQRTGQRHPLQLAGGEGGAVAAGQVGRAGPGQRLDDVGLADQLVHDGSTPAQPRARVPAQLVGDGRTGGARVLRHVRHAPGRDAGHRAADLRGGVDQSGEDGEQRGLARAAGAAERDQLPGPDGEVDRRQRGDRPPGEADGQRGDGDVGAARVVVVRRGSRDGDRGGRRQHRAGLGGGQGGVLTGVVRGAQRAQRGEGLGCQQQRGQPDRQLEVAVHQPQAHGDGDQRDRQRGEQFEHECGEEGQPQGRQRAAAGGLAQLGERCRLLGGAAQPDQHRQAADQLGDVRGDPVQGAGGGGGAVPGGQPDQHHEHRHQRQRDRHQGGREQVGPGQDDEQHRRHHDRLRQRREAGGQRGPEVGQPGGGQHRRGAGAAGGRDRGRGGGEPGDQRGPQLLLGAAGVPGGQELARPPGGRAQDHPGGRGEQRDGERAVGLPGRAGDRVRQPGGEQHQPGDLDQGRHRGADQRPGHPGTPASAPSGPRSDLMRAPRRARRAAARRSAACGTPSRSRPGSPAPPAARCRPPRSSR